MYSIRLALMCSLLWAVNVQACFVQPDGAPAKLVIPLQEPTKLVHNQFFLTILPEILAITEPEYGPCSLSFYSRPLSSARVEAYIRQNKELSLNWASAFSKRDEKLHSIKIPLLKGLMGHRIMIVQEKDKDLLADVKTIDDLKAFTFGLGPAWPDNYILTANGFDTTTADHYDLLFKMLAAGRYDLLSRGYNEAIPELELHKSKGLTIDEHLVLVYPLPVYFYVSPDNEELAARIELGLTRMMESGRFDALFYADLDVSRALKELNYEKRTKLVLCNPYVPEGAQLENAELWHFPIDANECANSPLTKGEPELTH